ncbi:hypothetical protein EYF80_033844 [Liparis tanakae]|uniref:Uncharacterized protein n=1 Tax=Liparis tanakae TaxID=230148 RepID=A0A4Z2GQW4_9TELE|nr:hypothetical protein EYF80_033844 [Liparis tanakae]
MSGPKITTSPAHSLRLFHSPGPEPRGNRRATRSSKFQQCKETSEETDHLPLDTRGDGVLDLDQETPSCMSAEGYASQRRGLELQIDDQDVSLQTGGPKGREAI